MKMADIQARNTTQAQMSSFFIDKAGYIFVSSYGATGDGVTNDTKAVQDAIDAAIAAGKKEVHFVGGKTYLLGTLTNTDDITFIGDNVTITGTSGITVKSFASHLADYVSVKRFSSIYQAISEAIGGNFVLDFPDGDYLINDVLAFTLNGDLEIRMGANARIYTLAGHNGKMLQFLNGHLYNYPRFVLSGGVFDASNVLYGVSNDSLWIQGASDINIQKSKFIFGLDYSDANKKGDSGISLINPQNANIDKCTFIGAPDVGIYVTGDSLGDASDDGENTVITGCHFNKCLNGVNIKRANKRPIIMGNTFNRCYVGIGTLEADALPPGKGAIIIANQFKYTASRAINPIMADGSIITNNRIYDFGKALDDTDITLSKAIWLQGSKNCIVTGNSIGFEDWSVPAQTRGILLSTYTFDSITHGSNNNYMDSNNIKDVEMGIREETAESGPSTVAFNHFENVATKVQLLNANSRLKNINTVIASLDYNDIAVNGFLELDTTVPGALGGDAVIISPAQSYGNIEFFGRVIANDTVRIRARNFNTTVYNPGALSLAISCVRG